MTMRALASTALAFALLEAGCSSWDTGSGSGDSAEQVCLITMETFARAAERCGVDYHTAYDFLVMREANGDCKNVRTIRDETSLLKTCLPYVRKESCKEVLSGTTDPSCSKQLQRTASLRPTLK
jgi:hypothetical protein